MGHLHLNLELSIQVFKNPSIYLAEDFEESGYSSHG